MYLSPAAEKAQESAATRQQIQTRHADRGPYLSDDGATIVIPSPARHERLAQVLRAYGFRFEYYDVPGPLWIRPVGRIHRGKHYTPAGWLTWARRTYARAWLNWPQEETDENAPTNT